MENKGLQLLVVSICLVFMFASLSSMADCAEKKPAPTPTATKVSKPGQYSGYSKDIYSGMVRISKYIYIRGVNLAIDIYHPAKNGVPVNDPYPVILQVTHYKRGAVLSRPEDGINDWVKRGYVVAVLDPRGTGDSFGTRTHDWSREEAFDIKEVIEWLAAQPYCNGKVAMWGISYMGGVQLMAASTHPPHLVSIIPVVTTIDQYMRHPNGVTLDMSVPTKMTIAQDATIGRGVDADPSGVMAKAAVADRKNTKYLSDLWPTGVPLFRNSYNESIKDMPSMVTSPITYKDEIKTSGILMYNLAGWYDQAPAQQLAAWKMWGGKISIGAWEHMMATEPFVLTEHQRWYDSTLKGIKNGIINEPPITYQTINAPAGKEWRTAKQWPLPNQKLTKYYFGAGPTKTVNSVNDGSLSTSAPKDSQASDDYKVDYSVQVFDDKFRENARIWKGDMAPNCDAKGLTYTTAPLAEDTEVTGHPVVHLWASSTSIDGYFFAFLEEVDPVTKKSTYVTSGQIKASNRAISIQSPWTDMGIPYHRCYDVDAKPLVPGQMEELAFDLYPTSYIFRAGKSIRVTITGSFQQMYPGMKEDPAPTISINHGATRASYIELPVIPAGK